MTRRAGTITLLLILFAVGSAHAQTVTQIRANGTSANRVDLVVLGDGFTAAEISSGAYATAVESFIQSVFGQNPYLEYRSYFNVWRVDLASAESGADHPERSEFKNTAFDGTYNCASIQRLICVNTSKVNTAISNSGLASNARDIVLVLVNDTEYGGSGGAIAVASMNSAAVELILHEVGHSFGLLADEYTDQPPTCNLSFEPSEANATRVTTRSQIKWNHWIDGSTPVPTSGTAPGVPGLYEGAQYCPTGKYRPTYNSKMRSLGMPFDQINTEQHVRRIYNFVSPIDSSLPTANSRSVAAGQSAAYSVTTPTPLTHTLDIVWRLDGVVAGTGTTFNTGALSAGTHSVTVTVRDLTTMVRSDPSQVLTVTRTWSVSAVGFTDDPLTTTTAIKAVHITELRSLIDSARTARGLSAFSWTGSIAAGVTTIQAIHITEMREALRQAYVAAGVAAPTYTDPSLAAGTAIRAVHISELRAALISLG